MKKKSVYYQALMYLYKNGDSETQDFIRYLIEAQAIKRGLLKRKI